MWLRHYTCAGALYLSLNNLYTDTTDPTDAPDSGSELIHGDSQFLQTWLFSKNTDGEPCFGAALNHSAFRFADWMVR